MCHSVTQKPNPERVPIIATRGYHACIRANSANQSLPRFYQSANDERPARGSRRPARASAGNDCPTIRQQCAAPHGHAKEDDFGADNGACSAGLETVDLDGLGIELQTLLLVDEELLDVLALVALKLDHLAHLGVIDDGAIAGCADSESAYVEHKTS